MQYLESIFNVVFDTLISTLKVLSRPKTKQLVTALIMAVGLLIVDCIVVLLGLPSMESPWVYVVAIIVLLFLLILSRSTVGGYIKVLQSLTKGRSKNEDEDE